MTTANYDWMNGPAEDCIVTKKELGRIFGMSPYMVDQAIARGAPVISRSNRKDEGYRISTAAFFQWRTQEALASRDPYDQAKTRKKIADAEAMEERNRVARSQLLTVDEANCVYEDEMDIVRRNLRLYPEALANALAKSNMPAEIVQLGRDEAQTTMDSIIENIGSLAVSGDGDDD